MALASKQVLPQRSRDAVDLAMCLACW